MENKSLFTTAKLTRIAMLAAIGSVLFLIEIPIVAFYKLDVSNLPVLLGSFSMGPMAGLMILLIKSLVGLTHSTSGGVGELADFILGAVLMLPAVLLYQRHKTRKSALIGMGIGTVFMMIAGVLLNVYLLIPFYVTVMHFPMEAIIGMGTQVIPSIDTLWEMMLLITAPFNLLKGLVLSLLTFVLYKHLSPLLHGRGRVRR